MVSEDAIKLLKYIQKNKGVRYDASEGSQFDEDLGKKLGIPSHTIGSIEFTELQSEEFIRQLRHETKIRWELTSKGEDYLESKKWHYKWLDKRQLLTGIVGIIVGLMLPRILNAIFS